MKDYLRRHINKPGKWVQVGTWIEHTDDNCPDVAVIEPPRWDQFDFKKDEAWAVAGLIAAAPIMLMVLKRILAEDEEGPGFLDDDLLAEVAAAIRYAELFRYGIRHAMVEREAA
jgi:hypothetical protein